MRKDEYFDMALDAKHFSIVVIRKEHIDMRAFDRASHIFGNAITDPVNIHKGPERDEIWINRHCPSGFR